ncbi:GNAT family protein [Colletotrichum musicola]|uniref:GNAT family protein n=1 Tax=Colletotrichum musicola TaxID=2175873 RepID=A0A8H6K247_9PEZI|nr:GNAT family protein [Colletotrichum musicola]
MGSTQADLVLAQPTDAERIRVWTSTHQKWGAALELDDYLRREQYLTTVPMSRNGGITQWILTDPSLPPDERPIYSSCESIRKRALAARPDGSVAEAVAHGIASVFTEPEHRGKGYASTMMGLLGPHLGGWQGERMAKGEKWGDIKDGEVAFSVLFSDIGKKFYAKQGWHPYDSTHLSFPPQPATADKATSKAKPVGYHELAELASVDEKLLRARLSKASKDSRARVALLPDIDAVLWHLMREDFMTKHIFGRTPTVRGAVVGDPGRRVWAVWTRGYYGGLKKPEGNTMHVLRLVVEDEAGADDAYVQAAVEDLLSLARAEAAEWKVNNVELWNPEPRIRRLVEEAGIPHEFVERETDSIASLMWYGDGDVEWVLNEKFGWC